MCITHIIAIYLQVLGYIFRPTGSSVDQMETLPNSLGRLVTGLVREFLEFFDLEYSLAVFDPESDFVSNALN
jgi:hypothetical protein